ncbi:MAG: hypothetical protein KGS72_19910 [Cyanobacteria bacterium REEB67]|nr:hypothetical protein [Cyanobacteria bacterium REEB67]
MKMAYLSALVSVGLCTGSWVGVEAKTAEGNNTDSGKSGPSLTDKPVGAKTTDELIRKIAQAYDAHDSAAYLNVVRAPLRDRMQMEIQFVRDASHVVRNFRYVSVAQEVARMGSAPGADSMGKDKSVNGVKSTYSLPVVGYIDFEVKSSPGAKPVVVGVPVGQGDGKFFLVTRVKATARP